MTRTGQRHVGLAFILSIMLTLSAGTASAQEDPLTDWNPHAFPPGARAYGMGGGFVAVADDASALYWNPAALVDSRFGLLGSVGVQELGEFEELAVLFNQAGNGGPEEGEEDLPAGAIDQSLSLSALAALTVGPIGLGAQGEGWMDVDLREQPVTAVDGEGNTIEYPIDSGEPLFQETVPAGTADSSLLLGARAGLGLRVLNLGPVGSLALGVAGNYYVGGQRFVYSLDPKEEIEIVAESVDPSSVSGETVFTATEWELDEVNGYSIDLGLKARLTPWISVGAVAHDVVNTLQWIGDRTTTEAKASYNPGTTQYEVVEDDATTPVTVVPNRPMRYQFGVAITPPLLGLTVAADLDSENVAHVGAEWRTLFGILALRAGYLTPLGGGDELPEGYGAPVRVGLGLGLPFLHLNAGAGFASTDELSTVQDAMVEVSLHF